MADGLVMEMVGCLTSMTVMLDEEATHGPLFEETREKFTVPLISSAALKM